MEEDLHESSTAAAYEAAMGMAHTSFRDRGPMTADEGDVIRVFFRSQTGAVVQTDERKTECN